MSSSRVAEAGHERRAVDPDAVAPAGQAGVPRRRSQIVVRDRRVGRSASMSRSVAAAWRYMRFGTDPAFTDAK